MEPAVSTLQIDIEGRGIPQSAQAGEPVYTPSSAFASDYDRKQDDEILDRLVALYEDFRDDAARQEKEKIWRAVYRAYHGYKPAVKNAYVIREIFRQIETLDPQIQSQLVGNDDLFKYMTMAPDDAQDRAELAAHFVQYQIRTENHGQNFANIRAWIKTWILFGTSYLTFGWTKFVQQSCRISPMQRDTDKNVWERKQEEKILEAPYLEHFPPWEVFTHPYVEDCRNSPAVFIRKIVTASGLRTLVREGYLDNDQVEEGITCAGAAQLEDNHPDGRGSVSRYGKADKDDEPHELLFAYTNDGWDYAILNCKTLVRANRCPYNGAPVLQLRNYPQVGEHFGIPEPLTILDDQRILNDVMAINVDSYHYNNVPFVKVKAGDAAKAWNNTIFKPGGKVELTNLGDIEPLLLPQTNGGLLQQADYILRNMQLATGVTPELSGTGSSAKTATAHVRLQDAAGERIKHKVRWAIPAFQELYLTMYRLNQMYLDDEKPVRVTGEDGATLFKTVTPESFSGEVDVEVKLGNQIESSLEEAQKWLQIYGSCGQDPLVNRQMVLDRLFRAIGESKPKSFRTNPANSQRDALDEIRMLRAFGSMPEPKPTDDQMQHIQILMMFMQTPEFMKLPQPAQLAAINHVTIHQNLLAQQQAAQQQASMQNLQGPAGGLNEANARTEMMFNNGQRGAAQAVST